MEECSLKPEYICLDRSFITRNVLGIARSIRDEYRWGELGPLSDALEDEGCTDELLLSHLRGLELIPDEEMPNKYRWRKGSGIHARGCHVLDLILGKE